MPSSVDFLIFQGWRLLHVNESFVFSKASGTEIYLLQQPLISYPGNKSPDREGRPFCSCGQLHVMRSRAKRKVADSLLRDKMLWCAKPWSRNG